MDVVEACYRLMMKLSNDPQCVRNQALNVGTGHSLCIKQLADIVRPQGDHIYRDPRSDDIPHSVVGWFRLTVLVCHMMLVSCLVLLMKFEIDFAITEPPTIAHAI